MKIIGFYTPNYKEVYQQYLQPTLKGYDHDIVEVDMTPDWYSACVEKPKIILEAMNRHPNELLIYIDVDARIEQDISQIETMMNGYDIGLHFFKRKNLLYKELLSGTLAINPSGRCVMERWVEYHKQNPRKHDLPQKALQYALVGSKYLELGPEWTYIFDLTRESYPDVQPLITHHQASRTKRKNPDAVIEKKDDDGIIFLR